MTRSPDKAQPTTARARAWARMRALGAFSTAQVMEVGIGRADCHVLLRALTRAGVLQQVARRGTRGHAGSDLVWRLLHDLGPVAPMVRSTGAVIDRNHGPQPARQQVWQAMRIFRQFTSADLRRTTTSSAMSLKRYVRALSKAGYLVQWGTVGRRGRGDFGYVWRLARDTGPLAPQVGRDGRLTDPNLPLAEGER